MMMTSSSSREVKELVEVQGKFHYRLNKQQNSDWCADKVTVTSDISLLPKEIQLKKKGKALDISIVGINLPSERLETKYYGYWADSKYGKQLKCTAFSYVPPNDKKGIEKFLQSKAFKGIGSSLAKRIVDEFGLKTIEIIEKNPEYLLRVRGISLKKLDTITRSFKSSEAYTRLSLFLSKFDISSNHIVEINNHLGGGAVEAIKKNPFCILDIENIGFSTADKIARGLNVMLASPQRILGAINAVLNEDSALHGNLWTDIDIVKKESLSLLNGGFDVPVISETAYDMVFAEAVHQKKIYVHKRCVFSLKNEKAESEAAKRIVTLLQSKIPEKIQKAYLAEFDKIVKNAEFAFSDDQIKAVSTVLVNKVSVLTGGPGTGKSTVSKAIIDSYTAVNGSDANVTLLAPTGKAARRLSETTGLPASTIHKACRIFDKTLKKGVDIVTLPEGLIIIDESSMIDAYVMHYFMKCIRSDKYHIVFVGDADQLPSVAAGSVLKEMINSGVVPCVKLTTTHRQGTEAGIIIDDAVKINNRDVNLKYSDRFKMVSVFNDEQAWQAIQHEYSEGIRRFGDQNVQVLCPLKRKKRIAVDQLNKDMQEIFNPKFGDDISAVINGTTFRIRDKVIQMKNTEEASNGDTGTIMRIRTEQDEDGNNNLLFTIEWDDGRRSTYNKSDMLNVELSYAMSIHKSQGCEFNEVIIPVMSSQKCPLFMKNLIYTAVTRAKEKVVIIGDVNALNYCILNDREIKRNSLFGARLKELNKYLIQHPDTNCHF